MPQNAKNMKPVLSVAFDLSDLSGDKDWPHSMDAADWGFLIFVCNLMTETEATSGTFCVLTKNETTKEVIYIIPETKSSETFRLFIIHSV